MDQFKTTLIKVLWVAAIAFVLYRLATSANFGLSAIEGLMVLIAAFVTHKTISLLIPTSRSDETD